MMLFIALFRWTFCHHKHFLPVMNERIHNSKLSIIPDVVLNIQSFYEKNKVDVYLFSS